VLRGTGACYVGIEGVRRGGRLFPCRTVAGGVSATAAGKALAGLVEGMIRRKASRPLLLLHRSAAGRCLKGLRMERMILIPLRVRRSVAGVLCVGFRTGAESGAAELRVMRAFGAHAAGVIARAVDDDRLQSAMDRGAALFRDALDGMFMLDPRTGMIGDVNPQGEKLLGLRRSRLAGKKFHSLFSPAAQQQIRHALGEAKPGKPGVLLQPLEIISKHKKRIAVQATVTRVPVDGGSLLVVFVRDLSEQARAEVKLAASEELLRIIVEGTLDMFFFVRNRAGAYTYVSPSVEKITGHTPEEWKQDAGHLLTRHPMNKEARLLTEKALQEGTAPPAFLCEVHHEDGRPILLEFNEKPVFRGGQVIGVQGVARDITERKRLEETIIESHDNLNRIIDQTPVGVMVFDAGGVLQDVNAAWMSLAGAKDKLLVTGRINILHSEFTRKAGLTGAIADVYRGKVADLPPATVDFREFGAGLAIMGEPRTVHIRMFPVFGRNSRLVNAVAMIEDVTERRALEEQLIQSQKMESVGLLAGGIAHDFNNILGGILGYASIVKESVDRESEIYPHLETIERSALRAADLTSQLLAFARGGKYDVGSLAINELVKETADLLRGTIGKEVTIITQLDSFGPAVEADATQIQQVLMNLCVNARDAMPNGGRLTVATRLLRQPDAFLSGVADVKRGPFVRIDVTDTGVGIDESIRSKIFDPFFTTKEKGKGTGLGLATVYGIIKNHGGALDLQSTIGVGTTFSVYLPAVAKRVMPREPIEETATGGKETVLIVDDEETIRMLVKDILEAKGYAVLCAEDGSTAIDLYRRHRDRIDLVILDMSMPGLTGKETFEKLKEINSGVRAILSTGYARDERAREMIALGVRGFVQKPYRIDHLAATVRKVLDRTGERRNA
jgi:two-component system, cell cycle sensor histidine kinase and response regulator CckA